MPRRRNLPAFPPGRASPSELHSRHSEDICKSATNICIFNNQICHCLNCFPRAAALRRSAVQPDEAEAGMLPLGTQPAPPQLPIPSRAALIDPGGRPLPFSPQPIQRHLQSPLYPPQPPLTSCQTHPRPLSSASPPTTPQRGHPLLPSLPFLLLGTLITRGP